MNPGSDIACSEASADTASSPRLSRTSTARRTGSAKAAKVRSKDG